MGATDNVRPFAFARVFAVAAVADEGLKYEELLSQLTTLKAEAAQAETGHVALLEQARTEAFEAGLEQARGERQTALLAAVDALQATLETVDAEIADAVARVTADATEIALAAADHLAARALASEPGTAIDQAIGRVLSQVARGTELRVRVHPDHLADVERMIGERRAGDRRELGLHLVADDAVAPGDACITWDGGGLALNAAEREAAIRAELQALLPETA